MPPYMTRSYISRWIRRGRRRAGRSRAARRDPGTWGRWTHRRRSSAALAAGLARRPFPSASPRRRERRARSPSRARAQRVSSFFSGVVRRAPQIPGGRRAVGLPALAVGAQDLRRRTEASPVGDPIAFTHAEIVDGQHVGPPEGEDQQHLDGPAADAVDRRHPGDDLLVTQAQRGAPRRYRALERVPRDVLDRLHLAPREPGQPQPGRTRGGDGGRRRKASVTEEAHEAGQDRLGGAAVQLLVGDGASERLVRCPGERFETIDAVTADQATHHGVTPEMAPRARGHENRASIEPGYSGGDARVKREVSDAAPSARRSRRTLSTPPPTPRRAAPPPRWRRRARRSRGARRSTPRSYRRGR